MILLYIGAMKTTHKLEEAAEVGADVEDGLATAAPTKAVGASASIEPVRIKIIMIVCAFFFSILLLK
jgi:hypothetical protein